MRPIITFHTSPTLDHTRERKKKAARKSIIHPIFASGRSEKNVTIQLGLSGSLGAIKTGGS
jgi:hypothetical protein